MPKTDTVRVEKEQAPSHFDPGRARRAVLQALSDVEHPVTARELRDAVRKLDDGVQPSSVDDQLDVLITEGKVAQFNFGRKYWLQKS